MFRTRPQSLPVYLLRLVTRGPFLESPGNFSGPQSLNNIWNLTIVELFYSDILIMNRDSLHTRSFRRMHFSVFRYTDDLKMALRARKSFRVFREKGPRPDKEFSRRICEKCGKFLQKQLKEICSKVRKWSKVNVPLFPNIPQQFSCSLKVI